MSPFELQSITTSKLEMAKHPVVPADTFPVEIQNTKLLHQKVL